MENIFKIVLTTSMFVVFGRAVNIYLFVLHQIYLSFAKYISLPNIFILHQIYLPFTKYIYHLHICLLLPICLVVFSIFGLWKRLSVAAESRLLPDALMLTCTALHSYFCTAALHSYSCTALHSSGDLHCCFAH